MSLAASANKNCISGCLSQLCNGARDNVMKSLDCPTIGRLTDAGDKRSFKYCNVGLSVGATQRLIGASVFTYIAWVDVEQTSPGAGDGLLFVFVGLSFASCFLRSTRMD